MYILATTLWNNNYQKFRGFLTYVELYGLQIDRMCSTDVFQQISEDKFL